MPKIIIGVLDFSFLLVQTRYKETPIRKYSVIHTGPKTELGGVNSGFARIVYQDEIEFIVKRDPKNPAS
jgi:hypothetical protein